MDWLVKDWFPLGHKLMDVAPEGSFKTIWGCYCAVCIASGFPILKHKVKQGPVLIVDEETPGTSLKSHLDRFSQGLGYRDCGDLPITVLSGTGFRFGRKPQLARIEGIIGKVKPVFMRLDSLIAMLPSGRQSLEENNSGLGEIIRDSLIAMLGASSRSSISLSVHSKKFVAELSLEDLRRFELQGLARGHGSIVGEGCDTGFIFKKVSEYPEPTRFVLTTRARRDAIPMSAKVVYIEMLEEHYGGGWARLEEISAEALPPSKFARELFLLFKDLAPHTSSDIVKKLAFFTRKENYEGVLELLGRRVILNGNKPQTYYLNPNYEKECDIEYLRKVR